ncbi:T9SS type A sorting domain-containing protein [Ferruginibacter sp.]
MHRTLRPKKILLFSFITIVASFYCTVNAQSPAIEWQKTIGGSSTDGAFSFNSPPTIIKPTADGGYIVGGSSQSSISGLKTENSRGNFDYWIVKLDAARNILWQKTFGGDVGDYLEDMEQTADGGYIIAGYSQSGVSGDKTSPSFDGGAFADAWIIKTDATGNIVWQKTYGGSMSDVPKSIKQTSDGGYILACWSGSESNIITSIGNKTSFQKGGSADYWVVKLDASGNDQWQADYGGATGSAATLNNMKLTADGGCILCGGFFGFAVGNDKTEASRGGNDFWLVKITSGGIVQWDKTLGGSMSDIGQNVTPTADGGYIVTGESESNISGDKTENAIGGSTNFDYWVLKLNSTGGIVWQNTIGSYEDDRPRCVEQTADGGYVIGGFSQSPKWADKSVISQFNDYWFIKMNADGTIEWNKTISAAGDDYSMQMTLATDGGILIAGGSSGGIQYDKTENSYGGLDYWIVKLSGTITAPLISAGIGNSCETVAPISINESNGNYSSYNVFTNGSGEVVAKINAHTNNLNNVDVSAYVNTGAIRQTTGGSYYLNRNITITPAAQPTSPVSIRLYILQSELDALIAQPGSGITSVNDLHLYKNSDPCQGTVSAVFTEVPVLSRTAFANGWQLEATVSSFSSFYFGSSSFVLPLHLLSFNAYKTAGVVTLQWKTDNEINTDNFEIEYSTTGISFEKIVTVKAKNNNALNEYTATDNCSLTAEKLYYRLKMIDKDGRFVYSPIAIINNKTNDDIVTVYPNPSDGHFTVAASAGLKEITLTDLSGKLVWSRQTAMERSYLATADVPAGMYVLKITTARSITYQKIVFK